MFALQVFWVCTLQLHGRVHPAFPLLGDVAVAFLNSMLFLFSDETLKTSSEISCFNKKDKFK